MNIFVAKLAAETTADDLKNLFEQYGEVKSTKLIFDRETGNSKRYGFIEMDNEREAFDAIENLNDFEFMGVKIAVKKSQPNPQNKKPYGNKRPQNRGGFNNNYQQQEF